MNGPGGEGWDRRKMRRVRVTDVRPRMCKQYTTLKLPRCVCAVSHTRSRPHTRGQSYNVGGLTNTKSDPANSHETSREQYEKAKGTRWPLCADGGHANGYTLATSTRNSHASSLRTDEASVAPFALVGASAAVQEVSY